MKSLLIKGTFLSALIGATLLAVYLAPIPHKHYLSAILNKRDLLKDERRNRIIFVGGSGLYCGLDSEMIQERLRRPVVNMGLYYGFGITPLLDQIKPYLQPGDSVVIIPEYAMKFDQYDDQARKWIYALAPAKNMLPVYQKVDNRLKTYLEDMNGLLHSKLDAIPVLLREAVHTGHVTPFLKQGYVTYNTDFNRAGDSLKGFPAAPNLDGKGSMPVYQEQSFAAINAFCRSAHEQGVQSFFMFPAHGFEGSPVQRAEIRRYGQRVRKQLDCALLGSAEDFVYPYRFFTNSVNHLNPEGKRKRTETVIRLLQKHSILARNGPQPAVRVR